MIVIRRGIGSESFPLPVLNLSGERWVIVSTQDKGGKVQKEGNHWGKMNMFGSCGECYEDNLRK